MKPLLYNIPPRDQGLWTHAESARDIINSVPGFLEKVPDMKGHSHFRQLQDMVEKFDQQNVKEQRAYAITATQIMRDMALAYHEAGHVVVAYLTLPATQMQILAVRFQPFTLGQQLSPMHVVMRRHDFATSIAGCGALMAGPLAGQHFEPVHHVQGVHLTGAASPPDLTQAEAIRNRLDRSDHVECDNAAEAVLNAPRVRELVGPVARFIYDWYAELGPEIPEHHLNAFLAKLHVRRITDCDGTVA